MPIFDKKPVNTVAPLNGEAKFDIAFSGKPTPEVKW